MKNVKLVVGLSTPVVLANFFYPTSVLISHRDRASTILFMSWYVKFLVEK